LKFTWVEGRLYSFLVIFGWGVAVASVVLNRLYQQPLLTGLDYILLFVISVFAGALLLRAKLVLLGWIIATVFSLILMFLCLTMPVLIGWVKHPQFSYLLHWGIVVMVFRALFPTFFITCLMGSIIGGFVGEELI